MLPPHTAQCSVLSSRSGSSQHGQTRGVSSFTASVVLLSLVMFITLLCRCTFLDRTGHVGAGDTSDTQAGSPGRIPCGIRPADTRVRHGAHGRSEAQDGRRLAGRRGGCDDGARPVKRAAGACVFVSRPRARRVIVGAPSTPRRSGGGLIRPWADSVFPRPFMRARNRRQPSGRPMVRGVGGGVEWMIRRRGRWRIPFPGGLHQAPKRYTVYIPYTVVCWKEHEP